MSERRSKNFRNKKTKKKGLLRRSFTFLYRLFVIFFVASILQVLIFKWLPPIITPIMVFDKVESFFEKEKEFDLQYQWKPIEEISPYMALAVIASEDQRFAEHFGFDVKAIEEAMRENKKGGRVRGASTITQQVAKNLFLWPSKDYFRKGLEAYYTLLMEIFWSKQRIVEMYVNIAEMGYGVYGVNSAAEVFYNKDSKSLNRNETALIAAVLPNPKKFSVKNPSGYIIGRRGWIVRQMYQLGDVKYLEKLK